MDNNVNCGPYTASGVSIIVPRNCKVQVSQNKKDVPHHQLASFTAPMGNSGGIWEMRLSSHMETTLMAWSVLLLVYMMLVSVSNIVVLGGSRLREGNRLSRWVLSQR